MFGKLRRDLDDTPPPYQPTVGGIWPEKSAMNPPSQQNPYTYVGHNERARGQAMRNEMQDQAQNLERGAEWSSGEKIGAIRKQASKFDIPDGGENWGGKKYKNGQRATRADFRDDAPNDGSLWGSDGQTNYYFTKNKVHSVGDIVTLQLDDQMVKDMSMEVKKTLSENDLDYELDQTQKKMAADAQKGRTPASAAGAPAAPAKDAKSEAEPEVPKASFADIDLSQNLGIKTGDTMMAEIVERYPNGNYKLRGAKRLGYRGGTRTMGVIGVARGADLDESDTVNTGKLYEYRVSNL